MRIISNFRDYYDCMQANGFDPMIVYGRTKRPQFINLPSYSREHRYPDHGWSGIGNEFEYETASIGFCGKFYLLFNIYDCSVSRHIPALQAYTIEDIDKFVEKNFSKKQDNLYWGREDKWAKITLRVFTRGMILSAIKRFNNPQYSPSPEGTEAQFIDNNTPIIVNHKPKEDGAPQGKCYITTYDDCLKDYGFYKVMEPWRAYQELSMFVGGPLVNKRKLVPEMDNKTKVASHGFDKYSFRRDPSS